MSHMVSTGTNFWVGAIKNGLGHDGFDQDTPPMSTTGRHPFHVGRDRRSLTQNRKFVLGQNQVQLSLLLKR
jgi:hypothetical protein